MEQNINEKVLEFLRRLEVHDFDGVQAMCTDRAIVWQNDGLGERAIGARMTQIKAFFADVVSLRYDVIRQFWNSHEVLQQQKLHLVMTDGSSCEVNATVFFRFEDGLVDRIEENVYPSPPDVAA